MGIFIKGEFLKYYSQIKEKNFLNYLLEQYWGNVNARQIFFWSPYHLQSQGSVEEYNRTVQNFLLSTTDTFGKYFDLKDVVNEFIVYYN